MSITGVYAMRCNARIPIPGSEGLAETYCQRKQGHAGEHSIRASDDPFTPPAKEVQPLLPMRPEAAGTEPESVPPMSELREPKAEG